MLPRKGERINLLVCDNQFTVCCLCSDHLFDVCLGFATLVTNLFPCLPTTLWLLLSPKEALIRIISQSKQLLSNISASARKKHGGYVLNIYFMINDSCFSRGKSLMGDDLPHKSRIEPVIVIMWPFAFCLRTVN